MKLYKLSQGSTFENLKHFIYLTNEYGVPSTEFVDDFINQFGKIILNGNFTLNQNQFKQLDSLWLDIIKDCEHNNIEYKENYSTIFYKILCQKAVLKIKEDWEESEWSQLNVEDKLELLKQFIINFDESTINELHEDLVNNDSLKYNYVVANDMYIGHELTITESVDDNESTYKAKVVDKKDIQLLHNNNIININKFIEEVESRNVSLKIKMGYFRFEDIYKERVGK